MPEKMKLTVGGHVVEIDDVGMEPEIGIDLFPPKKKVYQCNACGSSHSCYLLMEGVPVYCPEARWDADWIEMKENAGDPCTPNL